MSDEKKDPLAPDAVSLSFVYAYKRGEMIPQMRSVALQNIKLQRQRGMPKELKAFEIGCNVCINGRHFDYVGTTLGTKRDYKLTPHDVWIAVARIAAIMLEETRGQRFDAQGENLYLDRDGAL